MQGGTPAPPTGPAEQRQRGNWSRAMNPLLSTFSKQDSDHLLENLFLSWCPAQRNRKLQREKGAPVSYIVAQGGWGHWGCWQEAGLTPKLKREPLLPRLSFSLSEKVTWEQGKAVLSWETRGSLNTAALKYCIWGSHTLSPTERRLFLLFHLPPREVPLRNLPVDPRDSFENQSMSNLNPVSEMQVLILLLRTGVNNSSF